MRNLQKIMQEIIRLTTEIETSYPELYKYLDETPLSLDISSEKSISTNDLKNYLDTLTEQLKDHIKTHQKNIN